MPWAASRGCPRPCCRERLWIGNGPGCAARIASCSLTWPGWTRRRSGNGGNGSGGTGSGRAGTDYIIMVNEKYTSEQIIAAIKAVDGLVYLAARKLGCGPKTIYNRAKKTQAIQQAIEDSRGELVDIAEQKMRAAVMDREPWAVALVVHTLGKNRGYVEREEHTGAWGGPIAHRVTT